MTEQNIEKKVDESVAKFESWYATLPLAVRVLGDIVCLGVSIYLLAWAVAALGLFGLTSPNSWSLATWASVLAVCVFLGLVYELTANSTKHRRKSSGEK